MWFAQLVDALHYAHTNGVAHKDIKVRIRSSRLSLLFFLLELSVSHHSLTIFSSMASGSC